MSYFDAAVVVAIIFGIMNFWRLSPEVSAFVGMFKTNKRKDMKPQWASCGLLRKRKLPLWDGFCHLASDACGIYIASLGMPHMYVPWSQMTVSGKKRIWFRTYSLIQIDGFPNLTWCVPPRFLSGPGG